MEVGYAGAQGSLNTRTYTTKKIMEVDEGVGKLKENMAAFGKSMRWLKKYTSGATSKTRFEKEVNSLIKSYNEMSKNMDDVTDKDIQKQMSKLDQMFAENEKNFKKIGIDKVNGKYKIDSKKFDEADEKILGKLFEGADSFIRKTDKIVRKVEERADSVHYKMVEYRIPKPATSQVDVLT